jgi:hypothetical protein
LDEKKKKKKTHEEKGLHLVLVLHRHLVHIDDRCVSTTRNPAVLLDCLKDGPAVIAVTLIAGEPERDKQGFDGLRSEPVSTRSKW